MEISFGDISRYILIVTAVVSILYYKKYKHTPLRYIPIYLSYAAILEIVANQLYIRRMYNVWWYNIGINIEILFYLYLFYQYVINRKSKAFILTGGLVYETYFLINYLFFSEHWNVYQDYPFILGIMLVIVSVFLFFLEMFNSDKILHVGKYLIFWVGLGLLFYDIIPMPLYIGERFFSSKNYSYDLIYFIRGIQYIGNILMYFSFIYGFIWSSMSYKSL